MKIYVIGDSISIQYGPHLQKYLSGAIEYSRKEGEEEALLNLDNPVGANGGDSSMVLSFLKAKAKAGGIDADLLLLNCGLHDIKTNPKTGEKQISFENYKKNLKEIVSVVSKMKPKLVWIRTTPCDEKVHNSRPNMEFHRFSADCTKYNSTADKIMKEAGVPVIDLYTFTANLGKDIYCDHVHFHEHIREKQAAFIAGWLNNFS
ncbi:MAG TPA: lipase [Lentisphaeria bacterium]|nr:lipase [Lentisphaeria bacterium]